MTTGATQAPKAGRREWVALAVIALPCLLYSMDLSVLYLALPSLAADLRPSSAQLLWVSDVYGFMLAGFLITMGTLGDRIGRRRLLLIGAAAFGCASILAAFATSVPMLIVARALLGIAASTLAPSTLSLIRNMFLDQQQRTIAIGIWVTSFSLGAALGPLLGGVLLHFFWWGSVFLIAVPVMAILLLLGPRLLPEFRNPDAGHFDLTSALLSLISLLAIVYSVKDLAQNGFGTTAAAAFVAGLAVGLIFIRRQLQLAVPLVDLHLFRSPAFSVSLAANTLSLFLIFGSFFLIAQYLQLVLGLSPLVAGLWSMPSAAGFIAGSMIAPALLRRVGAGWAMASALPVATIGLVLVAQLPGDGRHGLGMLVPASVLLALGVSPVVTVATDLIVGAAPPERAGEASGISETATELGGALGIALLGSIATAVYRGQLAHSLPAALTHHQASAAQMTLADAERLGASLPAGVGAPLLSAARSAFTDGVHAGAYLGTALTITLALLAATVLRHAQPRQAIEPAAAASPDVDEATGTPAADSAIVVAP